MRMIREGDAGSLESRTPLVEVRRRAMDVRLGEIVFVGNPRTHDKFHAERLRPPHGRTDVLLHALITKPGADHLQAALVQQGLELLEAKPVIAAAFNFGEAELFYFVERAGDI